MSKINMLPQPVVQLLWSHNAWVVGSGAAFLAGEQTDRPRDLDILVPFAAWPDAALVIPRGTPSNTFGGHKLQLAYVDGTPLEVDVWPGSLADFFVRATVLTSAYHAASGTILRVGAAEQRALRPTTVPAGVRLHELKTWPAPFQAVFDGEKHHEVRSAKDRDFRVGDVLLLREFDPDLQTYTGRSVTVRVTYISVPGTWGLPADLTVLSVVPALLRDGDPVQIVPRVAASFPEDDPSGPSASGLMWVSIEYPINDPDAHSIRSSVSPAAQIEILQTWLAARRDGLMDDSPAVDRDVYHIRITVDLQDDTFSWQTDTGNGSLAIGIVADVLRRLQENG